jgi:hypothetical protein
MSAGASNRKNLRQALATALTTALTSVQAVYRYQRGGFEGQTPVVRVMSMGSNRIRLTPLGSAAELYFLIQIWVLYTDTAAGWSEEQAEDRLDDIDAQLASWLEGNRKSTDWQAIDQTGRSFVQIVRFQGRPYLVEDVPVTVKVY